MTRLARSKYRLTYCPAQSELAGRSQRTSSTTTVAATQTYGELIAEFPPRRITSAASLAAAAERIDAIIDHAPLSADEEDYIFALGLFIKEYKDRELPPTPLSDADLLADLLTEKGMTTAQLATQARIDESTIAAILKGTRRISPGQIADLCRIFEVSPVVFCRD